MNASEAPAGGAAALIAAHVAKVWDKAAARPLVAGICGAQGIGKSTVSAQAAHLLEQRGLAVLVLALDDLYSPRARRLELARDVHPLFATRGVPGTHDVALGLSILDSVGKAGQLAVPRFDKAQDDRAPEAEWPRVSTPVDVVLFEGWCVGAVPQPQAALAKPVNRLEAEEDREGIWRSYANAQLAGPYRALYARIDTLVLLAAPGFEVVARWRMEQEEELRARLADGPARTMDEAAITRFVSHYERITRHILAEMPPRADLVLRLDERRAIIV